MDSPSSDFEVWTRSEIAAAQARIAEMENALAVFLTWRSRVPASASVYVAIAEPEKQVKADTPTSNHTRLRATRNQPIFDAFEAAGSEGLSQEDVKRIAQAAGLNQNPNALRALCWTAKQDGRLISLAPGRYAIAPKNQAAVNNSTKGETLAQREDAAPRLPDHNGDGDAAPARSDHNQHRVGDAGGGI